MRPTATPGQAASVWGLMRLRYLEKSPIRVRGPVSGKHYDFSGGNPVATVEARDGEALLRTRFFRRED